MRKSTRANIVAGVILGGAVIVWVLSGETRRLFEPELAAIGDEKAFGGPDPHLYAAVVELQSSDAPVAVGSTTISRRVVVGIRLRSSAAEMPVDPGRLNYVIVSHTGGRYEPDFVVTHDGSRRPWTGPPAALSPGDSVQFRLEYVFPATLDNPRLWIVEKSWILRYAPWLEETPLFPKLVVSLDSP